MVYENTPKMKEKEESNIEDDLFTTPQFLIIIIFALWCLLQPFFFFHSIITKVKKDLLNKY